MVVIIGMQGEPAVAEAGMTLQQPEVLRMFSQGSCPWIMPISGVHLGSALPSVDTPNRNPLSSRTPKQ